MRSLRALAAAAILATASALAADATLEPYIACDGFAGGVRAVQQDRRPRDSPPYRDVVVDRDARRVSVVDGYRVLYSYPRTLAFANLKAERSDPAIFAADKRVLTEQIDAVARAEGDATLVRFTERGHSGMTLTKPELRGTTVAITQIFYEADGVVVTIYFLNQAPGERRFATVEEFVQLRDAFVQGYIDCVAARRR